jgi:hypothetical protein
MEIFQLSDIAPLRNIPSLNRRFAMTYFGE